jgi:hypothetical protein
MPPITTSNPSAAADEVMPFKTAMTYGLCSSGTTTMARVSSRGRAELDRAGRYLESLRCFWTRRRVSGETSARSLSTFDTVATETPAASAISASVVLPFGTVASGTKVSATRNYYDSLLLTVYACTKAGANSALDTIPDCSYFKSVPFDYFETFRNSITQPITLHGRSGRGHRPWRSMSLRGCLLSLGRAPSRRSPNNDVHVGRKDQR